jgi:hypothetical protein
MDEQPIPLFFCLHLIEQTGRHYVFNLHQEPVFMYVNEEKIVWTGHDNNLQEKFVEVYKKLLVEKLPVCVITSQNCVMLSSDQLIGLQLRYEPGY